MLPLATRARSGVRTLALCALVFGGCSKRLSEAECTALLDRYVEKLVGSDRPGTTAGELFELKAKTRETAARDPAFAECSAKVSRRQFECAMSAKDVDHMEICLM